MSGGQNLGTIESPPGPLFVSGLGHLARYCTSVNLYHMWLNMFIKFVENNVPINKNLCNKSKQFVYIV